MKINHYLGFSFSDVLQGYLEISKYIRNIDTLIQNCETKSHKSQGYCTEINKWNSHILSYLVKYSRVKSWLTDKVEFELTQ